MLRIMTNTVAATAVLVSLSASYAGIPSFHGLGNLPGGSIDSRAIAASADGCTIVGTSQTAMGTTPFRWTATAGLQSLDEIGGSPFCGTPQDVSTNGSIVVGLLDAPGPNGFRWSETGDMTHLYRAFGVSANGDAVVGGGPPPTGSGPQGFLWTEAAGYEWLGYMQGGNQSTAQGISADGTVVLAGGLSSNTGPSGNEAAIWTPTQGMVGIGDLPGGDFLSYGYGISGNGLVVVGMSDGINGREAFRWTSEGGMVGLGDLPGGPFQSEAWAVSGDGSVVVGSGLTETQAAAFVWDETNGMRDLQGVLTEELGLALDGWQLIHANDVSDDGSTIVGWGRNPQGEIEAWVATIPEPATGALLFVTAIGARSRPRRCRNRRCEKRIEAA